MAKTFKLKAGDIEELTMVRGGCFATDRITVEGLPVRFMYREAPEGEEDTGWRFCSAIDEDEAYMDDPDNISFFDVNTIANYDRSIIPFLMSPVGAAFEKPPGEDEFVEVFEDD
ncbi:MAG: DUF2185 domain-containing protein [Pseudomonadota bacterium]